MNIMRKIVGRGEWIPACIAVNFFMARLEIAYSIKWYVVSAKLCGNSRRSLLLDVSWVWDEKIFNFLT